MKKNILIAGLAAAFFVCGIFSSCGNSCITISMDELKTYSFFDKIPSGKAEYTFKITGINGELAAEDGAIISYFLGFKDAAVNIILPDTVTSLGENALEYYSSLKSIKIPDTVTLIGEDAFDQCENLISVNIPDSVTSIGDGAFSQCKKLTEINIPDSVTSIGDCVFSQCENLTKVRIPDSVTHIGDAAFEQCFNLQKIDVDSKNPSYSSENGVLFDKDKTTLILYPCSASQKSFTIPDSVVSIGEYTFYNCKSLESVYMPDSVESIGECAFFDCDNLKTVRISNSVKSIGEFAFCNCRDITSMNIPDSVETIGQMAFDRISHVSITVPLSVKSLGYAVFSCPVKYSGTISDWKKIEGYKEQTDSVICKDGTFKYKE